MQANSYTADRVLTANDITEYLAERGVRGEEHRHGGLKYCCPLHNEDTPSFYVYPPDPARGDPYQHYHCYGCKKTGNLITLRAALEGTSYRQVISDLADGLGIKVGDQIDYLIDQMQKASAAVQKDIDEIETGVLLMSHAVYQHLQAVSFDPDEMMRCEAAMKLLDESAERRNKQKVQEVVLYLPDILGDRARAFYEEREKRNAEAARVYAKI